VKWILKTAILRLHTSKPGIRVLGVAESFEPKGDRYSTVCGVVMRKDGFIIDGIGFVRTKVGGNDATRKLLQMYNAFRRQDINVIMLSGAIISHYNIVDVDRLSKSTGRPVICLTYRDSTGIEQSIRSRFGKRAVVKLAAYKRLGRRVKLVLSTGKSVFVRCSNIQVDDASSLMESFLIQGRYPEPVRVASLAAAAARHL